MSYNEAYEEARLMGVRGRAAREQAHFDGMFSPEATSAMLRKGLEVGGMIAPDNGTKTSREAAVAILPHADTQRAEILAVIAASDAGLTRENIEDRTTMPGNSIRPRIWELVAAGLVEEVPGIYRFTRSGRRAAVLRAV